MATNMETDFNNLSVSKEGKQALGLCGMDGRGRYPWGSMKVPACI